MSGMKLVVAFCGALLLGSAFSAAPAAAAPMVDPFVSGSSQTQAPNVEKARIVCNAWGRCWRTRPRYYAPRFYYGRPVYRRHFYRGPRYYRRRW